MLRLTTLVLLFTAACAHRSMYLPGSSAESLPPPDAAAPSAPAATVSPRAFQIAGPIPSPAPASWQQFGPLAAQLLRLEVGARDIEPWFTERPALSAQHQLLEAHLEAMTQDLEAAAETTPPDPALLHTVAVGQEVAALTLDVMVDEYRARAYRVRIQPAINRAFEQFLWPLMRQLDADPRWASRQRAEMSALLLEARIHRGRIRSLVQSSLVGYTGVKAAGLVTTAWTAARLVGTLPAGIAAAQAALGRLSAWLKGLGPQGGTLGYALTPQGVGLQLVFVPASEAARPVALALAPAEVVALAEAGTLSATAAELYLMSSALGGGSGGGAKPTVPAGSTQKWDTARNAEILRDNMKTKAQTVPDDPTYQFGKEDHAHHIVPSTSQRGRANEGRKLLERWGIDINSAENGVAVPESLHNGAGLHTRDAINEVVRRLEEATNRDQAILILRRLAQDIRQGRFPARGVAP